MLKNFVNKNIDHIGIEPAANVAKIAKKKGLKIANRNTNGPIR